MTGQRIGLVSNYDQCFSTRRCGDNQTRFESLRQRTQTLRFVGELLKNGPPILAGRLKAGSETSRYS